MIQIQVTLPQVEIKKLTQRAQRYGAEVTADVVLLIDDYVERMYQDIRANAPVDQGDLRKSIKRSMIDTILRTMTGEVSVGVFYARFVEIEYGGVKRPATPFVRPAYDKHIPGFIADLRRITVKRARA